MKHLYVLIALIALALGALGVRYGERDDSPGFMFLSLVLAAVAVTFCVRALRRLR